MSVEKPEDYSPSNIGQSESGKSNTYSERTLLPGLRVVYIRQSFPGAPPMRFQAVIREVLEPTVGRLTGEIDPHNVRIMVHPNAISSHSTFTRAAPEELFSMPANVCTHCGGMGGHGRMTTQGWDWRDCRKCGGMGGWS